MGQTFVFHHRGNFLKLEPVCEWLKELLERKGLARVSPPISKQVKFSILVTLPTTLYTFCIVLDSVYFNVLERHRIPEQVYFGICRFCLKRIDVNNFSSVILEHLM